MSIPITLLLIEDSNTDRAIYRRFLSQDDRYTYQIIEFDNGSDALEWCQQQVPDLILLDYCLPSINGLEFLERLNQQNAQLTIPVILVTAYGNTQMAIEAMKRGALDYLDKHNLTAETLRTSVHGVIEQIRLKRQLERQREWQRLVANSALQIRQSLELKNILNIAVREVRLLLETDRVLICQFYSDSSGEVVMESVGEGWKKILGDKLYDPCFGKDCTKCYQYGSVRIIEDVCNSDLDPNYIKILNQHQIAAKLSVPLWQGDDLWGLLIVHHCHRPRQWQSEEVEALEQLAVQLSIAIQQAAINEQLRTELRIRQQTETRFQAMFEQSPEGEIRFAPDGSVISANHAWEQIWETTAHHLAEYNILQDPVVEKEGNLPLVHRAFAGEAVRFPLFFHDPSQHDRPGRSRWIDLVLYPIKDRDGRVLEVVMVTRDMTDRKQAEIALQQSEERYRRLAETIEDVFWLNDAKTGKNLYMSPAYEKIWGRSSEPLQDNMLLWTQAIHPEDRERVRTEVLNFLTEDRYEAEFRILRPDGSLRWILDRGFTIKNEAGEVIQLAGAAQDITDRKLSEIALQTSEEKLRLLIQYAPASIVMLDRQMHYIMASDRFVKDYNVESLPAIIGRSFYETLPEIPDRWKPIHQRCLAGANEKCDEDFFVRSDGAQIWLKWEAHPWYDINDEVGGIVIFSEDITQRKLAEEALRQSENRLRLALVASKAGAWEWDILTNTTNWSPEYYQLCQLDPTVMPSYENWINSIHPDDREATDRKVRQALQDNSSYATIEFRVRRADGWRWMSSTGQIFRNAAGEPLRILGLSIDITERKQTELALEQLNAELERRVIERTIALQEQQQFSQQIADTTPALVYIFDLIEQRNIYINSWVTRILGYSPAEVQAMGSDLMPSITHPDDIDRLIQRFERLVYAEENVVMELEYRLRRTDGSWCWLYTHETVFKRSPDGKPSHILGIAQDITDRKRLEQELLAREKLLTTFFETASVANIGLSILDTDLRYLKINQYLAESNAQPVEAHLGQTVTDMIPEIAPLIETALQQVLQTGQPISNLEVSAELPSQPGMVRYGLVSYFPIAQSGNLPFAIGGIVIDITERKQAEQQLQQLTLKLQESNQELEHFAFIASHDLKEPLRTMRNFSTLLQMTAAESLNEQGRDYLNRIDNAAQRMQNLIEALLVLSRVSTNTQSFVPVDLNQAIQQVAVNLENQLQQTGGRIEVGELPTIQADPDQIGQLFQNLVSNALKFRQDAPPIVKIYLKKSIDSDLCYSDKTDRYCLYVEDNGIGFDPKYGDRIFGIFERLHGRSQYEGTGIGLAICRKIVERHGGTIEARSTPGQGSIFMLTFPKIP